MAKKMSKKKLTQVSYDHRSYERNSIYETVQYMKHFIYHFTRNLLFPQIQISFFH